MPLYRIFNAGTVNLFYGLVKSLICIVAGLIFADPDKKFPIVHKKAI